MSNAAWNEAQVCLIGAMLLWQEDVPKVLLGTRPSDFTGPYRTVYDSICRLSAANIPIDPASVLHDLNNDAYKPLVKESMDLVVSRALVDRHMQICREQARTSSVRALAQQLSLSTDPEEMDKLIGQINTLVMDRNNLQIMTPKDGLEDFYRDQTTDPQYLPWPIKKLNGRLCVRKGGFVVIGGTPSAGKTAWALQCASFLSRRYRVGFFSLETDNQTLRDRMYASIPGVSLDQIQQRRLTDRGWEAVAQQSTMILQSCPDLIDAADYTITDIRSVTAMRKYDVIFIDYLQLINSGGNTRYGGTRAEEVAAISRSLKLLARSLKVTIVALSQLKRKEYGGKPSMSDLRESGQIEQDGDVIMILQLKDAANPDGPRELYVVKNKQGKLFMTTLAFDGAHQLFSEARLDGSHFKEPVIEPPNSVRRPYDLPPPDPPDQVALASDDWECPF